MVKENIMQQTEIGLIPEEWEVKVIEEIITEISMGPFGSDIKVSNFVSKGVPVLNGYNISGVTLKNRHTNFVTREKAKSLKKAVAKRGDIVVTHRGTIGQISYIPFNSEFEEYVISQSQFRFSLNKKKALYDFVVFFFHSDKGQSIISETKGHTGVPAIAQATTTFKKIAIPLPPLPEQKAIAEALSDTDLWIESLEQLIAKKRLIKQGAMQELLTPKEDWEVKKLGEVAYIVGGGTPSTFRAEFWNGKIEWFTPTEVGYNKYLFSSTRRISNLGLKNSSATVLPVNTILLTSRAGIGDLGIIKIEASTNQGFQSIICKETVDVEFIYYLMSTKKEELLKNASGSTFLEISPNKVKSLEIKIPFLTEQIRIAKILSHMDAELEALEMQLAKARQVKQGMMQELLTGKVRLV